MNPYRQRIWAATHELLDRHRPYETVLDFGSGDGWFANQFLASGLAKQLTPIDIKRREKVLVEPQLYPGGALPFADRSFELVYAIDVLHHCPEPMAQLLELARCSSRYLFLKDHTYRSESGRYTLAVMDELGNRKFGIPSLYKYQKGDAWHVLLVSSGFRAIQYVQPFKCHVGLLGAVTNRLQYVALYERT